MRLFALVVLLASACAASAGLESEQEFEQKTARPNILWITCEDLDPDLGCYGDPIARTPNLDALARESLVFDRAYATAPVCSPARTALFFGMHQTSLGAGNHRSRYRMPGWLKGFPEYLRGAGYFVTNHWKTDYNAARHKALASSAFDEGRDWRDRADPEQPFFSIINIEVSHASRSTVWPRERFEKEVGSRLPPELRTDPSMVPVLPYHADTPEARRDIARYYDCIAAMDLAVGRILTRLEADGLADSTVVFFFSDHGGSMPRHKSTALETGLRVPLLVRVPEMMSFGVTPERRDDPVSFVDLGPTVLKLAGVDTPSHLQGVSIFDRSRAHVVAARDRIDERIDCQRTLLRGDWVYLRNFMLRIPHYQPHIYQSRSVLRLETLGAISDGRLDPIASGLTGPRPIEELYNLASDPHQLTNLAIDPDHQRTLFEMRSMLAVEMLGARDINMVPEGIMRRHVQESGLTPYELGERSDRTPLEDVHRAAWLVGTGQEVRDRQLGLAGHPHAAVRFWATIGIGEQDLSDDRVLGALIERCADEDAIVRASAAWALARAEHEIGFETLRSLLEGDDLSGAEFASRVVVLLGESGAPLHEPLRIAAEREKSNQIRSNARHVEVTAAMPDGDS